MKIEAFDIEANGLLDTVSVCHCANFRDLDGNLKAVFRPHQLAEMLKYLDSVDVLIGHNLLGYDLPVLKKLFGYEFKGKKVDTLTMSRLLNPKRILPINAVDRKAGPHSLYAWGVRLGVDKPEHEDWENFSEEMLHRNVEDTRITVGVYKALMKEAHGKNWKNAFLLSFKLFEFLHQQEQYGWKVDVPYMHSLIEKLDRKIERIDRALLPKLPDVMEVLETKQKGEYKYVKNPFLKSGEYNQNIARYGLEAGYDLHARTIGGCFTRVTFRKLDLNSNDETKQYLLKLGWEPFEWNTNDAGERTSPKMSKDDPFEGITSGLGRLIALRVRARQRKSIIEGLLKLVRADGSISSVVNNLADTARATHRNIVNIPKVGSFFGKQMRKIFIAREGMVLVGTDSDSCQLRMLGARMGSQAYIEALINGDKAKGTDLHSMTRKIAELESRDIAKNVIYALLFGAGDTKLGKTAKQPGNGSEIRSKLYKGFDGLEALVDRLTKEWKSTARKRYNHAWNRWEYFDGYITGLDGRPIKVPYEHQLLVYLLQSDEAIMMQAAYNRANIVLSKKYKYGVDFGFVCWYHDEYTIECKPEIAEDVRKIAEEAIVWAGNFYQIPCPHVGDGKIGESWYAIH